MKCVKSKSRIVCRTFSIPSVVNTEYNTFMRSERTRLETCETYFRSKAAKNNRCSISSAGYPPLCHEHHSPLAFRLVIIAGGLLVLLRDWAPVASRYVSFQEKFAGE